MPSRACKELGIQLILANIPQAKGRVERLFGTLQDLMGEGVASGGGLYHRPSQ